ncbi:uncharacterized protein LOC114351454 [Ostrinia furnacalis]|uniref:uncharacterized protein LOC114351454 n=1 Tax=Ostrinia furnacalis TaxID=93504 RepID=UPI00104089C0|nr:uncharacterized protein LOC114351454 [Ostrinia furnacalis]
MSYADASQSHLQIAVTTVPPRDLTMSQAERIRIAIDDRITDAALTPGTRAPSLRGRPYLHEGAFAFWCEDARSREWLENQVKSIPSPIPDTTLTVVKLSEVRRKLRAGLLLHSHITDPVTLQKVISNQNPWYKVDTWQCISASVTEGAEEAEEGLSSRYKVVYLVLGIPEDQKQTILDRDRRVSHLSGGGYIRFFSSKEEESEATTTTTAATKETSTPEPSTSAPHQGQSELEKASPLKTEGGTSEDEDGLLNSP